MEPQDFLSYSSLPILSQINPIPPFYVLNIYINIILHLLLGLQSVLIPPSLPFLRIAQWNANGLQNHKEEITIFLRQNYIDIFLISETHFTDKNYFHIPRYKLCHTTHPDGTAHGGTVILIKESIQHYELLKYEEDSIQPTSIKVVGFP
jgi:hypothetical protein